MVETSAHVIERQTFDLRVADESEARRLHESLRHASGGRLEAAIDRVLTRIAGRRLLRIDQLEIELGSLSAPQLEAELAERVERALADALQPAASSDPAGSPEATAAMNTVDPIEAELAALARFAETGTLPWWIARDAAVRFDELCAALARRETARVGALLRARMRPVVARRLALQFTRGTRTALLAALLRHPDAAAIAEAFAAALDSLARESAHSPHRRAPKPADEAMAWECAYMLTAEAGDPVQALADTLLESATRLLSASVQQAAQSLQNMGAIRVHILREAVACAHQKARAHPVNSGPPADAEVHPTADLTLPPSLESAAFRQGALKTIRDTAVDANSPAAQETAQGRPTGGVLERYRLRGKEATTHAPLPSPPARDVRNTQPPVVESSGLEPETKSREMREAEAGLSVANAGLVILWPFLPELLRRVGLLEGSTFPDTAACERAALLLQHLADNGEAWPEHELSLNKLMCGLELDHPLPRNITLASLEQEQAAELLASVISRWTALGTVTADGLRGSFLLRDGRLRAQASGWKLEVNRVGYDVLLDRLPWGIGTVMLPWMPQPLYVEW